MVSLNEVRLIGNMWKPVFVGGYLETREWTDNDGQDHYTTELLAEDLQGLGVRRPADG